MLPTDERSKTQIKNKLSQLEEAFDREMRARGFDPSQVENVALPANLAKLYAEREELRLMIEEIGENE